MKPGEIYFIRLDKNDVNEIVHPFVICKVNEGFGINNRNYSVCMISTNMKKAYWPGNIVLKEDEAGLPKRSIIIVAKTENIQANQIKEYIGKFSDERFYEILESISKMNSNVDEVVNRKSGAEK